MSDAQRDPVFWAEAIAVLEAVERGEVTIPPAETKACAEQYCNDFAYHLSNGWVVVVFNDCDEWDYLSEIHAPDGRSWSAAPCEPPDETWFEGPLGQWVPHAPGIRERWGISP